MRVLTSAFFWIYWAACIISFCVFVSILYLFTFPFDRYNRIPNGVMKGLAWIMIRPGWRCTIKGADPRKTEAPTIVVANHQSFMDIPLVYLLPWSMKWVAKKDMFKIPIFGWIVFMTGQLGIDRKSRFSAKKLDKLVEPIKKGIPAMIFPEGTRSSTGELQSFKNGAFNLARQYNFKVLPVVLEGGYKAMPPGDWKFSFKQELKITVLNPVDPAEFNSTTELKNFTYSAIKKELETLRAS